MITWTNCILSKQIGQAIENNFDIKIKHSEVCAMKSAEQKRES